MCGWFGFENVIGWVVVDLFDLFKFYYVVVFGKVVFDIVGGEGVEVVDVNFVGYVNIFCWVVVLFVWDVVDFIGFLDREFVSDVW